MEKKQFVKLPLAVSLKKKYDEALRRKVKAQTLSLERCIINAAEGGQKEFIDRYDAYPDVNIEEYCKTRNLKHYQHSSAPENKFTISGWVKE